MSDNSARDFSFLADPGQLVDWRMVLLADAAGTTGLLDALPGDASELAGRLSLDARAVRVVLDALTVFGVVTRSADGTYAPGAEALSPDNLATLNHHARSMDQWAGAIGPRLRNEEVESSGPPADPARWLDSLAVNGRRQAPASVDICVARLPDIKTVLDLGGCHGEYALEFARRGLSVTMQDRPVMINIVRSRGVLEAAGIELFDGDFFEALPPKPFDLVFCSGVTNTFGPDRNQALYPRVRDILSPGGALVIHTFVGGHHPMADLFSVQMLNVGNGGASHTESDYRGWLAAAGFGPAEVIDLDNGRRTLILAPAA